MSFKRAAALRGRANQGIECRSFPRLAGFTAEAVMHGKGWTVWARDGDLRTGEETTVVWTGWGRPLYARCDGAAMSAVMFLQL